MEYIANHIELTGCLASAPQFSHDNHGRRFFSFYLEVARLSGTVDRLPVLVPEPLLQSVEASEGASLRVEGQIRSFNSRTPAGSSSLCWRKRCASATRRTTTRSR